MVLQRAFAHCWQWNTNQESLVIVFLPPSNLSLSTANQLVFLYFTHKDFHDRCRKSIIVSLMTSLQVKNWSFCFLMLDSQWNSASQHYFRGLEKNFDDKPKIIVCSLNFSLDRSLWLDTLYLIGRALFHFRQWWQLLTFIRHLITDKVLLNTVSYILPT